MYILSSIITKQGKTCKGLEMVEPTGQEYSPRQRQARTSVCLAKLWEGLLRLRTGRSVILKQLWRLHDVSKESEPGREPGHVMRREERATRLPPKSNSPCHGTWAWKYLIRLILCLDTIFYTIDWWLSMKILVAHRSGILMKNSS